mmetsp:Transcript_17737/g.49106  ORF Transcript_17737/g.49106 Transcript_17737/m.49106 type:complete len:398 (-) Transcript_17737:2724-3917(-)|eukprot:CAMPEP_0172359612 /NCGR_PEP_ID=MMETSP1060-20121228/3804_1 /TAXON_ID=37318 /ORGANISM="Pseudo-nitzschia pungens, Strain cf. cingulata" /LENGTH=397 /DNA_ID=CAMNT_0013081359 /DNA_START=44 /DNA_END=1237 /DNA_ORIENTATION=+
MEETVSDSSTDRGNEDFNYIGTGGFLIECGDDNEVIGITKEQSELVRHNCPFFQKCLHHGFDNDDDDNDDDNDNDEEGSMRMREATSRIIRKPDWSLAIVRHFIELLTKGKTTLPNLELVDGILAAGDQSLVDLRLSSLVNYQDPCSKENDFMRLVDPSFFRFRFQAVITSDQWLTLLDRGILLYREETNFVVQLYKDRALERDQSISRRKLDNQRSEFLVHTERSIEAIYEIQKCLSCSNGQRSNNNGTAESFSIYFETSGSIPKEHHQLIDRLAGGEAYIRTCADAAEYQTEGYTVKASLDVLKRVRIAEDSVIHCTIRVDNPAPDTLGRFINACQKANDYPGTLGVDASINRYFCRKSMKDVMIILNYMSDYSTSAKISSEFHLFSLSSESESF